MGLNSSQLELHLNLTAVSVSRSTGFQMVADAEVGGRVALWLPMYAMSHCPMLAKLWRCTAEALRHQEQCSQHEYAFGIQHKTLETIASSTQEWSRPVWSAEPIAPHIKDCCCSASRGRKWCCLWGKTSVFSTSYI